MGRGKHFDHKQKGHEPKIPIHGDNVHSKHNQKVEYGIEPVASEGARPVTIKVDKDL
ncbi:hypothetical protein PY093_06025 [Cytobacillus sp. S13-E01]|uniref:hypothetical protein n=1 Tax=Cytobacillus sp. S13-E01 TaxID=3031326 RepID=UPI0023D890F8|nr:hypothetical protein [Cytobacillus sp. S13-E01]MDF0726271.1 hypothetical protein [Cytobacillus sp. S13-E01]